MKKILFITLFIFGFTAFAEEQVTEATETTNSDKHSEFGLEISNFWARPSRGTPNSAAYMTIKNTTNADIKIIAAIAPKTANRVELHSTFEEKAEGQRGVMRMAKIDNLVIPAYDEVVLKPKALHIMLMQLKTKLEEGDKFQLSLMIEDKGNINLEVPVQKEGECCKDQQNEHAGH